MYTRTAPRSGDDAIAALTANVRSADIGYRDSDVPLPVLLDALRAVAVSTIERDEAEEHQRKNAISWSIAYAPTIDEQRVVPSPSRDFTFPEAAAVVQSAFPHLHDNSVHHVVRFALDSCHGVSRLTPIMPVLNAYLTYDLLRDCALLLKAGWDTNTHEWTWWTAGSQVTLLTAAQWVSRWDLDSLTACIRAGFSETELLEVLLAGELPDPDTIAMMVAFRAAG